MFGAKMVYNAARDGFEAELKQLLASGEDIEWKDQVGGQVALW